MAYILIRVVGVIYALGAFIYLCTRMISYVRISVFFYLTTTPPITMRDCSRHMLMALLDFVM